MQSININSVFTNITNTIDDLCKKHIHGYKTFSKEPEPIYPTMVLIDNEYQFVETRTKNNFYYLQNYLKKSFFCPKNGFIYILPINQLNIIKNNINNYEQLSTSQLNYLEKCTDSEKMEIIHLMNKHIHHKRPKIKEID